MSRLGVGAREANLGLQLCLNLLVCITLTGAGLRLSRSPLRDQHYGRILPFYDSTFDPIDDHLSSKHTYMSRRLGVNYQTYFNFATQLSVTRNIRHVMLKKRGLYFERSFDLLKSTPYKSSHSQFMTLKFVIILSGDVEMQPGPNEPQPQAATAFPCCVMRK